MIVIRCWRLSKLIYFDETFNELNRLHGRDKSQLISNDLISDCFKFHFRNIEKNLWQINSRNHKLFSTPAISLHNSVNPNEFPHHCWSEYFLLAKSRLCAFIFIVRFVVVSSAYLLDRSLNANPFFLPSLILIIDCIFLNRHGIFPYWIIRHYFIFSTWE